DGRNESVRPAIQGGVDYTFDSGFYVGNWNSTGRFGNADLEVDAKGGYRTQLSRNLGIDAGYIHYFYPGEGSSNSGEVYAGLQYRRLGLKVYRGMRQDVNKNDRSEEHTSELQSRENLVCRLLLEKITR